MDINCIVDPDKTIAQIIQLGICQKVDKHFISTGIREFDIAMDGGLRGGELVVISGETGQGKTTFAQTLTCNLSKQRISSLWFSYEMMDYYLADKFKKMGQTITDPIYSPIDLVDGTLEFIEKEIKEAISDDEFIDRCKVVFIDHLHYLIPLSANMSNSSLAIGGIVRGLKQMAIRNKIVVVLIAHTKKIYADEELDLSSVRDSSLICQEADYVFLVKREKQEPIIKKKNSLFPTIKPDYGSDWLPSTIVKLAKNRRLGIMNFLKFIFIDNILVPITKEYENQTN